MWVFIIDIPIYIEEHYVESVFELHFPQPYEACVESTS